MSSYSSVLRDRPFNLQGGGGGVMVFFFVQNLTLGYMTKTLNQIIFFSLHQNQNIFFSNIGNQNIFFEKNHSPLEVKWSVPYDNLEEVHTKLLTYFT